MIKHVTSSQPLRETRSPKSPEVYPPLRRLHHSWDGSVLMMVTGVDLVSLLL